MLHDFIELYFFIAFIIGFINLLDDEKQGCFTTLAKGFFWPVIVIARGIKLTKKAFKDSQ